MAESSTQKSFWKNITENPASVLGVLGAIVAALVALISFWFNYHAAVQNQRDTQFYEALKRFGDKDSPTLRSTAAGMLTQMARTKIHRFNSMNPLAGLRHRERPYFITARDQLAKGLLFEENRIAIMMIGEALTNMISIDPDNPFEMLNSANFLLQEDMAIDLANFFVVSGAQSTYDVNTELWEQAAAMTPYKSSVLKVMIRSKVLGFSDVLKNKLLTFKSLPSEKQLEEQPRSQQTLRTTAFRLFICANVCGGALADYPDHNSIPLDGGIFLADVNLKGANLEGKNLKNSNLIGTNLQRVNMSGASLQGASLCEANLEETRLWNVRIDSSTNVQNANWWEANFYDDDSKNVDLELLHRLYKQYKDSMPENLTVMHPSVKVLFDSENGKES